MSIQDKLTTLVEGKQAVVDAVNSVNDNGLELTSEWGEIADTISNIVTGQMILDGRGAYGGHYLFYESKTVEDPSYLSYLDWSKNESCAYMFGSATKGTHCTIKHAPYFDTSNCNTFSSMFVYASDLESLPEPFYDTSKVTSFANFLLTSTNSDPSLDKLGKGKEFTLNCPVAQNLAYAFSGRYFKKIKINNTNTCTNLSNVCMHNPYLETLDINTMDGLTTTSSSGKIVSGQQLTKFILRNATKVPPLNTNSFANCYHFKGTVDATYNPTGAKDGRIYVPDSMVNKFKTATNWSTYADVIVPLSTLVED